MKQGGDCGTVLRDDPTGLGATAVEYAAAHPPCVTALKEKADLPYELHHF